MTKKGILDPKWPFSGPQKNYQKGQNYFFSQTYDFTKFKQKLI